MAAMHYATLPLRTSQGMMSNVFGNGIAIITMQSIIYDYYTTNPTVGGDMDSPLYGGDWTVLYTSFVLASGIADILLAAFIFLLIAKRSRGRMIIGLILCTVTGLLAAASCALSAIELGRIYDANEEPLCANNGANNIRSQCLTWWVLELFVCIFSATATGSCTILIGCIFLGCLGGK